MIQMKLDTQAFKALKDMIDGTSKKVIAKYKAENPNVDENVILFTGDSMIEFFKLDKYIPEIESLNRGIAGATTKTYKDHFNDIFGDIKPKAIYVSIGSNDLVLLRKTPLEVYSNVLDFFIQLRAHYKTVDFHYISMTPVINEDHKLYKKIYVAGRSNEDIIEINSLLEVHFNKVGIEFINVYDALVGDDGYLNENYTADGIHLNDLGYQIYSNLIKGSLINK